MAIAKSRSRNALSDVVSLGEKAGRDADSAISADRHAAAWDFTEEYSGGRRGML